MESLSNTGESRAPVSLARIPVGETVVRLDVQIQGSLREYVMRYGFVPGASIFRLPQGSFKWNESVPGGSIPNRTSSGNGASHHRDSGPGMSGLSTSRSAGSGRLVADRPFGRANREIKTAAILGPPNSGKSTLFNRLTALRQKVANYPGVTVEHRVGTLAGNPGGEIMLIDLPGVYDLTAYSEDERVAAHVLRGEMPGVATPEAVLIVLDATNLERHLTLVPAVLQTGLPALVILNMADLLAERGGSIDLVKLAGQLGVPVALVSATNGRGIEAITGYLKGESDQRPKHCRFCRSQARATDGRRKLGEQPNTGLRCLRNGRAVWTTSCCTPSGVPFFFLCLSFCCFRWYSPLGNL